MKHVLVIDSFIPVHQQLQKLGAKLSIICATGRIIGGDNIPELVQNALGVDMIDLWAKQVLGQKIMEQLDIKHENKYSAIWFIIPKEQGIIEDIPNLEDYFEDIGKVFEVLEKLLVENLKLSKENLYIMYDENNLQIKKGILKFNFMDMPYDKERLICSMPINKEAMYVKVNYYYRNGLVSIVNLVFIGQKENQILLDSVIYAERLLFILNKHAHVYEEEFYKNTINVLIAIDDEVEKELYYGITSHLRIILYFYSLGIRPSSKKVGYILRKLEMEVFTYLILNNIKLSKEYVLRIFNSIYENSYFNFPIIGFFICIISLAGYAVSSKENYTTTPDNKILLHISLIGDIISKDKMRD
ncbi:hypothetical protein [Tepidimicrobium xylanilyticum]